MKKAMILFAGLLISGLGFAGGVEKGSLAICIPCAVIMAVCGLVVAVKAR